MNTKIPMNLPPLTTAFQPEHLPHGGVDRDWVSRAIRSEDTAFGRAKGSANEAPGSLLRAFHEPTAGGRLHSRLTLQHFVAQEILQENPQFESQREFHQAVRARTNKIAKEFNIFSRGLKELEKKVDQEIEPLVQETVEGGNLTPTQRSRLRALQDLRIQVHERRQSLAKETVYGRMSENGEKSKDILNEYKNELEQLEKKLESTIEQEESGKTSSQKGPYDKEDRPIGADKQVPLNDNNDAGAILTIRDVESFVEQGEAAFKSELKSVLDIEDEELDAAVDQFKNIFASEIQAERLRQAPASPIVNSGGYYEDSDGIITDSKGNRYEGEIGFDFGSMPVNKEKVTSAFFKTFGVDGLAKVLVEGGFVSGSELVNSIVERFLNGTANFQDHHYLLVDLGEENFENVLVEAGFTQADAKLYIATLQKAHDLSDGINFVGGRENVGETYGDAALGIVLEVLYGDEAPLESEQRRPRS